MGEKGILGLTTTHPLRRAGGKGAEKGTYVEGKVLILAFRLFLLEGRAGARGRKKVPILGLSTTKNTVPFSRAWAARLEGSCPPGPGAQAWEKGTFSVFLVRPKIGTFFRPPLQRKKKRREKGTYFGVFGWSKYLFPPPCPALLSSTYFGVSGGQNRYLFRFLALPCPPSFGSQAREKGTFFGVFGVVRPKIGTFFFRPLALGAPAREKGICFEIWA